MRAIGFQFTPLREGRLFFSASTIRPFNFNSRPSARGDFPSSLIMGIIHDFNSRPSARGDRLRKLYIYANLFQFTPLREGRLK